MPERRQNRRVTQRFSVSEMCVSVAKGTLLGLALMFLKLGGRISVLADSVPCCVAVKAFA